MKWKFFKISILIMLYLCAIQENSAQREPVIWHGKISTADCAVTMSGDIRLAADGELHTGSGSLSLAGRYRGEPGSMIFHNLVKGNSNLPFFLDVSGDAEGMTEIIPETDSRWDETSIDLIRAKQANYNTGVFFLKPVMPDCGDYYVQLQSKKEEGYSIWSVTGTKTLPLIKQLSSHTLLVNNNPLTNGGHCFSYYKWYRDGQLLKEDAHEAYGGSYYTGGADLDADADYTVEATGSDGVGYFSCPYRFTSAVPAVRVTVYPNPVPRNAKANIRVETADLSLLNGAGVEVYDLPGRYVGAASVSGQTLCQLNLPLKSGIYQLKYRAKDFVENIKLIIE